MASIQNAEMRLTERAILTIGWQHSLTKGLEYEYHKKNYILNFEEDRENVQLYHKNYDNCIFNGECPTTALFILVSSLVMNK